MAKFTGQVTAVSPIQSGTSKSGKEWKRIDVCLCYDNTNPDYPKAIKFSVMNGKIEEFHFKVGEHYEVDVDFSVREWKEKYYMDATCWRAMRISEGGVDDTENTPHFADQYQAMGLEPKNPLAQNQPQEVVGADDLPF